MNSSAQTPVLIVGAGPTGLTLAVSLAMSGVRSRIIDRAEGPNTASRAKTVQPRSLEVLDQLGAVGPLLEIGRVDMPMRFHDISGAVSDRPNMSVRASEQFASPYPDPLWIAQFSVEASLRARLAELGGPTVEYGATATDVVQDRDGVAVSVLTTRGAETIRASYVVAADGGRSTLRKLLAVDMPGFTIEDEPWYLGDVVADDLDRGFMHIWTSPEGMVGLTPLPGTDLWQLQSPLPHGAQPEQPSLALYQRLIDERAGSGAPRLRDPGWISVLRGFNVRMADRYRVGRVFLAGDAAHVHSPAGGQGMNTGIQDAANLGWKLAAVLADAPDALLDTYAAERMPVAAAVLADSSRKMHLTAATVTGQSGDGLADALGSLADDIVTGLPIGYPASPLSDGARTDGTLLPGDRMPDVPGLRAGGRVVTLFDLTRGPRWTALTWGGSLLGDIVDVAEHVIGVDVEDPDGTLQGRFGGAPGTARSVLIRPDGYLATRGSESELRAYLRRWLGTSLPVAAAIG